MSAVLAVGTVADVHPVGAFRVVLHDQLVEVAVVRYPGHPLAALLFVTVDAEVCGLALGVLTARNTAHLASSLDRKRYPLYSVCIDLSPLTAPPPQTCC